MNPVPVVKLGKYNDVYCYRCGCFASSIGWECSMNTLKVSAQVYWERLWLYCEYLLSVLEFGKYEVKMHGLYCRRFCGRSRKAYWCTLIRIRLVRVSLALSASIRLLLSARTVMWTLWMERLWLFSERLWLYSVNKEWIFQGPTISFGGMGLLIKVLVCEIGVDGLLMAF